MNAQKHRIAAAAGGAGMIPSLIIVSGGLWQILSGQPDIWERTLHITPSSPVIHPLAVLGGLFLSIALNALAVCDLEMRSLNGALFAGVSVRWKSLNAGVFALSGMLLGAILLYLVGENFVIAMR